MKRLALIDRLCADRSDGRVLGFDPALPIDGLNQPLK